MLVSISHKLSPERSTMRFDGALVSIRHKVA